MTNEQTPPEDELEITDPDEDTDEEIVDDAQDDEPSELGVLRAELEELKKDRSAIDDLKRSVGRIQSLAAKFESAPDSQRAEIQSQINERFSSVEEQIAAVVSGMDETAIDPATRQRILQVQEQARRAAEVQKEVEKALAQRSPQPAPQQSNISPLERELLGIIDAAGMNPDDERFNWQEMSQMLATDPAGSTVRKHVLGIIVGAQAEDQAATRRTTAKRQAGSGSPKQAAVTPNPATRMAQSMDSGDFGAAYSELKKLLQGAG